MIEFLHEHGGQLMSKTLEHFYISIVALLLAIIVAVPIGILLSKTKRTANIVLTVAGVLQTIPTLAVLAIMIPIFGVGKTPAIVALFIYVLLPILNNTFLFLSLFHLSLPPILFSLSSSLFFFFSTIFSLS
ncbi:ABC transporter permease, partial [Staphylococcus aureus]|uniref:ABC transporter permease n=1 Tax=Staphylococcus aureus TaxID=1280 RepID=UPI003D268F13